MIARFSARGGSIEGLYGKVIRFCVVLIFFNNKCLFLRDKPRKRSRLI